MPISLDDLRSSLDPSKTVLLLGAGASVTSGAPSGADLARLLWKDLAKTSSQSDDLIETASILERRYGRRTVINFIVAALRKIQPTGGLLGLPLINWHSIFSTNFDLLMESSYKSNGTALTTIRSNYDLTNREARSGVVYYKIHGCITQDRSLGDKSSMILTEQDYDEFDSYRKAIFSLLQTNMLMNDVLIIGQSLRDKHLQDLVKKVLSNKAEGTPGQVFVIVYDRDDLRAPLLEDRGARIIFSGIDEFVHSMSQVTVASSDPGEEHGEQYLPLSLVSTVIEVSKAIALSPNISRMFNGGAAVYADVRMGTTFERIQFTSVLEKLEKDRTPVVAIIGAAGVGKTTFARSSCSILVKKE